MILLLSPFLLSSNACSWANFHSVHRDFELGGPEGRKVARADALDAKQRVVLSKRYKTSKGERVMTCAEPSPDALQALSAALAAAVQVAEKGSGEISANTAEGALNIGLRTQSIQLLRDAMYRICEGYFSSAIGGPDYQLLHLRYRDSMVALLAIEQLTGAVRPQLYGIGAGGTSSVTSESKSDDSSSTSTTTVSGTGSAAPALTSLTDEAAQHVAEAVDRIVQRIVEKDYTLEYCLTYLSEIVEEPQVSPWVSDHCKKVLDASAKRALTAR
ncbi:MAG: hypothetical protein AAF430_01435 [Myxococcota bacterium]